MGVCRGIMQRGSIVIYRDTGSSVWKTYICTPVLTNVIQEYGMYIRQLVSVWYICIHVCEGVHICGEQVNSIHKS